MPQDVVTPLADASVFEGGAFADLVAAYDPGALDRIMMQATRACENETGHRLAPFTLTETHRLAGVDPDEYVGGDLPLDLAGTVGRSYANALSGTSLVRHLWLREYAPLFPDLWSYANVTIQIIRSYGGSETLATGQFVGAEPDTGHVWFNLGTFTPVGSWARVTYSGGYTIAVPGDLERACMYMAASIVARELDPLGRTHGHDPDGLEALAVSWLSGYMRTT